MEVVTLENTFPSKTSAALLCKMGQNNTSFHLPAGALKKGHTGGKVLRRQQKVGEHNQWPGLLYPQVWEGFPKMGSPRVPVPSSPDQGLVSKLKQITLPVVGVEGFMAAGGRAGSPHSDT